MRTIISHFYNEAYLLPWWLRHHVPLFDYGVMINHGSTDHSVDIIRELAPHWRIVNSSLLTFDAYMTDFEVMTYEREIPGWKIALNTTEFLVPSLDLNVVQSVLQENGKTGIACSGYILVDEQPDRSYTYDLPLVKQAHWGFSDNSDIPGEKRIAMNLGITQPSRNRFFHCNPVGMYYPGRHSSFHPDSNSRLEGLMIFHYAYAPWNEPGIARKLGIKGRLSEQDIRRGWGVQHLKRQDELNACYALARSISHDLTEVESVQKAFSLL